MRAKSPKKTKAAHPAPVAAATATAATAAPRHRFVISHLLSPYEDGQPRAEALERFSDSLQKGLLSFVDVVSEKSGTKAGKTERRVLVVDADPRELRAKAPELSSDTIIEPELLRVPALAYPAALLPTAQSGPEGPGTGASLDLLVTGPAGEPAAGATLIVRFDAENGSGISITAGGITNSKGAVSVPFNANLWRPSLAAVEPAALYWTAVLEAPQSGQTIRLQELPQTGPYGWWHLISGLIPYHAEAGTGIRVGVIDSGVGPHPNLAHAIPIGAFIDGGFLPGAAQGLDVQKHGTHVSGIIGARPAPGSAGFSGFAPGSELYMARVFTETGGGNQGDVANAIDVLAAQYGVDIINMSFVGAPSAIEHDAIIVAFQRGTVCVCAAGNQTGSPVGYPAAYPECIAVSALGLLDTAPPATMPACNVPAQPDWFGVGGLFLASFSNVGQQLFCAAAGNGVVSTVPATAQDPAPYVDMSGTSMSSPVTAGVLAALLASDPQFTGLPRDATRAAQAKLLLRNHALGIGLSPFYQGGGLARL